MRLKQGAPEIGELSLFWKKEKTSIIIDYPSPNRRCDYRVRPSAHTPIRLSVGGELVTVRDISHSGVLFYSDSSTSGFTRTGDRLPVLLYLGDEHHPMPVTLLLIAMVDGEYRCQFQHPSLQGQKILCRFIVKHQKQEIRAAQAYSPRGVPPFSEQ
tara:strand:- start:56 stop:523 length:468 start_codon:yes stop_codon:yes gene_type:complete